MRTPAALLLLLTALALAACSNEEAVVEPDAVREELPAQGELLSAAEYVARGDGRLESGDYSAAIRDFAAALAFDKDDPDALQKRAAAYVHISLFHPEDDRPQLCRPGPACQYAIDDYDRLVKLLPSDADAHYRRGVALSNAGRFPECPRCVRQCNRARPLQRRGVPEARLRLHAPERRQDVRRLQRPDGPARGRRRGLRRGHPPQARTGHRLHLPGQGLHGAGPARPRPGRPVEGRRPRARRPPGLPGQGAGPHPVRAAGGGRHGLRPRPGAGPQEGRSPGGTRGRQDEPGLPRRGAGRPGPGRSASTPRMPKPTSSGATSTG